MVSYICVSADGRFVTFINPQFSQMIYPRELQLLMLDHQGNYLNKAGVQLVLDQNQRIRMTASFNNRYNHLQGLQLSASFDNWEELIEKLELNDIYELIYYSAAQFNDLLKRNLASMEVVNY
ncbi:MAG: hypothetical protein EOO92_10485 [Pedobacter sp.]|nr:MAG: hypothetical protein EOO92_10485 [Pedobacter sp.]